MYPIGPPETRDTMVVMGSFFHGLQKVVRGDVQRLP